MRLVHEDVLHEGMDKAINQSKSIQYEDKHGPAKQNIKLTTQKLPKKESPRNIRQNTLHAC
jgi:hypothetical protein